MAHCWTRMLFGAPCKGNSTLHLACNSAFQAVQLTVSCSCLEMMVMSERGTLASEGGWRRGAICLVAKVTLFPLTETKRKRIIFPGGAITKSLDAPHLPPPLRPRLPFVTARLVIYNIRDPGVCKTRLLTFHRMLRNVKAICISAENVLSLY